MSTADDSQALSWFIIVVTFAAMYAGIRTCRRDTTRSQFWLGLIGYFAVAYLITFLMEAMFSGDASLVGVAIGIEILVVVVLGFAWGQLSASRTLNMGYRQNMAWITLIPILGVLWLGIAKTGHAKGPEHQDDKSEQI